MTAKKTGVIVLNFGEPDEATEEKVVPFLRRIFEANASLESAPEPGAVRKRSEELARRRAPGLLEEYEEIGGSPLNEQAHAQASALSDALRRRGHDVATYVGMQFAEPLVADAVARARNEGVERLVALPVYPLAGPSTTVDALEKVAGAVDELGWDAEVVEVGGWHRHPAYVEIRADGIRATVEEHGLDFDDPGTRLVFSAHGTPLKYLDEGSRYLRYVEDSCRALARAVGVDDAVVGFQNHANRDIPWTRPDVEAVIEGLEGERAVVVPVSFMHEQSETLAELDIDLREEAEEVGLDFYRVPVPHDDPRFAGLLADVVECALAAADADSGGEAHEWTAEEGGTFRVGRCQCRATSRTWCLNSGEV